MRARGSAGGATWARSFYQTPKVRAKTSLSGMGHFGTGVRAFGQSGTNRGSAVIISWRRADRNKGRDDGVGQLGAPGARWMSTVLVVDDSVDLRLLVAAILRKRGFNVHCAENGREALAARSEEHTSELQSRLHLVCRLL